MNRWLALALAIVGGAIAAWVAVIGLVAVVYGFLWIYVFGDSPWPDWVDPVLGTAAVACGLAVWVFIGFLIWRSLRRG